MHLARHKIQRHLIFNETTKNLSKILHGAWFPLVIAAVAYGVSGAFGVCRTYLQYLGCHRSALWPMAGGILLNLILNVELIPPLGIEGAALATFISLIAIRAVQVIERGVQGGGLSRARRTGHEDDPIGTSNEILELLV